MKGNIKKVVSSMTLRLATGYTGSVNKTVYPVFIMDYDNDFRITDTDSYRIGTIRNAPNPHLRWERTRDMKAGLEVDFLKERLHGRRGEVDGPVQLKFLKKEEVKDKIVLKVDPSAAQYVAGDPGEYTITIVGSDYFKIEGTWYVYQQPTDKEAMKGYRYFSDDAFTEFPAATEADTFTFDTEKNVLATSLQSDLKNFFGETCNRVPADKECSVRDISDRTIEYQLLLIDPDNCNRDFSATSTSADKNAYIDIRLVQAQDPSEDTLKLYLLDYQATSFLAFLTAYYMYNDKRPVATTSGVYKLFYQIRRRAVISGSPSLCLCPERSSEKVFRKGTICSDPATTDRRDVPQTEFIAIFVGREKSAET